MTKDHQQSILLWSLSRQLLYQRTFRIDLVFRHLTINSSTHLQSCDVTEVSPGQSWSHLETSRHPASACESVCMYGDQLQSSVGFSLEWWRTETAACISEAPPLHPPHTCPPPPDQILSLRGLFLDKLLNMPLTWSHRQTEWQTDTQRERGTLVSVTES